MPYICNEDGDYWDDLDGPETVFISLPDEVQELASDWANELDNAACESPHVEFAKAAYTFALIMLRDLPLDD